MASTLSVILALSVVVSLFSYHVQADRMLSLSQAINLAMENDPETKNTKRSIEIGQTKRTQAKLGYLPRIDVGMTNSPQVDYFGQPVINTMLWNSSIGMEQPLYAGGTIKNSLKLADSEIRRQELDFSINRHRVATEATKAYFQSLSTQGTVAQYQALLQHEEEDLREAQTRLGSGTGSRWRY